jgi:transcriptional regulator with PAS, ATPase and Fis domain
MKRLDDWAEELGATITVTSADGTITAMNAASRETFAAEGGAALIGRSVFDCHDEPARTKTRELYDEVKAHHYTIRKNGRKKIVHQMPYVRDGRFAGIVEIVIPIPEDLPHFDRNRKG